MTSFNYSVRTLGLAFAALLLLALPFALVPKAHADGFDDFGWGDYYPSDFGGGYNYYPDTSYNYYPDTSYNYYPDTSYDYYPDTSSYGNGSYGGYGSPMSYGMGGFGGGFPFSYGGGGGMPGITNVNQNQNQNTCTAGSCNTSTAINAPTTVSTISYPQPTYQQPNYYPPAQPTYYQQPTYSAPVSYNRTPYVSLSAVPYTGLDLGPWGTAAYWGFLVLWCLGAAYLVVVKKIHYKFASWFIGGKTVATRTTVAPKAEVKKTIVPASQLAGVDPFIASQINRAAF